MSPQTTPPFERTLPGKIARYRFFSEPLMWVEGPNDVPFFREALRGRNLRIEVAGGKDTCLRLAEALATGELPFCVVFDGDYEMLEKSRSRHHRVVQLRRYSVESYFCEAQVVDDVCRDQCKLGPGETIDHRYSDVSAEVDGLLKKLVTLDVACVRSGCGAEALPRTADQVMIGSRSLCFDEEKISKREACAASLVPQEELLAARELVDGFCRDKPLLHLMRGKVAIGMLRRLVLGCLRRTTGSRRGLSEDSLRLLLIKATWQAKNGPSREHKNLRRRLVKAVRSAGSLRGVQSIQT